MIGVAVDSTLPCSRGVREREEVRGGEGGEVKVWEERGREEVRGGEGREEGREECNEREREGS